MSGYTTEARVRITGEPPGAGWERAADVPGAAEPVAYGVHPESAHHYGLPPDRYPPKPTTVDHFVGAVGACLLGTFAGALEGRRIRISPAMLEGTAVGTVEEVDDSAGRIPTMAIRRIDVTYRLKVDDEQREAAQRAHDVHKRFCWLSRSIEGAVEVSTTLELAEP